VADIHTTVLEAIHQRLPGVCKRQLYKNNTLHESTLLQNNADD